MIFRVTFLEVDDEVVSKFLHVKTMESNARMQIGQSFLIASAEGQCLKLMKYKKKRKASKNLL